MPHLLMAKYTAPVMTQMHARTAIPLFIVSVQSLLIQQIGIKRRGGETRTPPPELSLGNLVALQQCFGMARSLGPQRRACNLHAPGGTVPSPPVASAFFLPG